MTFRLDHVVIGVRDLPRAAGDYRSLGFTVTAGGRHPPPRTSSNALVVFEDGSYLELIAWDPPNPEERWSNLVRDHGEGFLDYALWPEDIAAATEAARRRGLPLAGPLDGRRVRPDGMEVRWRTSRQSTFDLPFLCADVTARALRVPEGEARRHANGARGISRVVVGVADVEASIARYQALLGVRPTGQGFAIEGAEIAFEASGPAREMPKSIALAGLAAALDPARTHGALVAGYR